ncbi:coil containing protein [Vibrio phage 1.244.A._10N.261.54.C3]|nr:coil containing protein [Vibrio phage 1.244.A._10N.261.54.C3]AUR98800.1 coil containing protein [Vibrio phage 1.255.O._10N.286.45.F1]
MSATDKESMNAVMVYLYGKLSASGGVDNGAFKELVHDDLYKGDWTIYPSDITAAMLVIDEEVLQAPMRDSNPSLWDECIIQDTQYRISPARDQSQIPFSTFMDILSYTQERATNHQAEMVFMMGKIQQLQQQQDTTSRTLRVINKTIEALGGKVSWMLDSVGIINVPAVLQNIVEEIKNLGGDDIDTSPVKPTTKH